MLSRNSDMRLGLRLSPLDRPDLGEWLERRVDRDRLDLRGEEDLMDIFRILIYISATAMTQAIFEEDSGPARARLCAQLDHFETGDSSPVRDQDIKEIQGMEATQVKTEEAVQAPGKKEPPKLKVPKRRKNGSSD